MLCPGGMPFGVKFVTDGVTVVGFCDVQTKSGTVNPATDAGLRQKDVILALNGEALKSAADLTDRIPVRAPKKPRRIEQRTVLLLVSKGRVALVKRPPTGLLAGLWEFPTILGPLSQEATKRHLQSLGMAVSALIPCVSAVHIFSHIEWHMQSYLAVCDEWPKHWDGAAVRAVTLDELRTDYAVGTAHRAFVQALESELKQSLADS
jgi:adenine-specific DNA glycosylase